MVEDPAEVAKAELKEFQEVHGMEFTDPDAPAATASLTDPNSDADLDMEF